MNDVEAYNPSPQSIVLGLCPVVLDVVPVLFCTKLKLNMTVDKYTFSVVILILFLVDRNTGIPERVFSV